MKSTTLSETELRLLGVLRSGPKLVIQLDDNEVVHRLLRRGRVRLVDHPTIINLATGIPELAVEIIEL